MTHVGSNVSTMQLQLKDWDGQLVAHMREDSKMLGYYSPEDGWTIHINDTDINSASAGGWLEDVSKVKKYVMSDEAYGNVEGSYKQWKNAQIAKDPTWWDYASDPNDHPATAVPTLNLSSTAPPRGPFVFVFQISRTRSPTYASSQILYPLFWT